MPQLPWKLRRHARSSDAVDHTARAGLVVYGVVHLVLASTVFLLVLGDDSRSASSQGAFAVLASSPLGEFSLWLVAAGMLALIVWQVAEAVAVTETGIKRHAKRLIALGRIVVYGVLGYNAAAVALRAAGSGGNPDHATARLMSAPGGQVLVAGVGVAVISVGAGFVFIGVTARFRKHLDHEATSRRRSSPILVAGRVGYVGKGLAFGAVGALFVVAAVQHQPKQAGGLDIALEELLRQPLGPALVAAVAASLACFGLYCFAWARHLER